MTAGCLFGQSVNPKPVKALGAPRLIATQANPLAVDTANPNWVEGKELNSPTGIAIDNSTTPPGIYISDTANNRILGWHTAQFAPGTPADIVVGQPNGYQTSAGGPSTSSSRGLNAPTGLAVDSAGNLYVADSDNNRVLRFPTPLASNQASALNPDLVIGQTSFASNTSNQNGISASSLSLASSGFPILAGLVFDTSGSLYVSDVNNNRILVYPASALKAGVSGPAANLVLGQPSFNSSIAAANRLSTNTFSNPNSLAIDFKGRLYVGDALFRVLVFQPPFITGSSAYRLAGIATQVSGQPTPASVSASAVGYVQGVTVAGQNLRLVAVDASNSRALIYDPLETWPDPTVAISPTAQYIIGQSGYSDHTANRGFAEPTAGTLNSPYGAAASTTELFIADTGNNRILVYAIQNGVPTSTASRVIGQLATNFNAPNLIEGREFNLISSGRTGAAVIDRLSNPPHLYVADPGNNRVLCFKDAAHVNPGDIADLIIGQPDGYRAVINYPSGLATNPSATSLYLPVALALDPAGNLWVADSGNGRVLRFSAPFASGSGNMPSANLVIGQVSFTSQLLDASSTTMHAPHGLAFTSDGSLLASDLVHNRVLYFPQPLFQGMPASKVLGQFDFNSSGPNGSTPTQGGDPARFIGPRGIAVDSLNRVYVSDSGSSRVVIFGNPALLPTAHALPALTLTTSLSQPIGIAIGPAKSATPDEIWVADAGANAMYHYPPFSQITQISSPDYSFPVNTPLSDAYDSFNNLVVADGTSRVLFYVPSIAIVNGANYLTRAVSPGSVVSIFPSSSNNVLGTSTVAFNSLPNPLPLPITLGDTQVLINSQPVALFYVSPSQINLPLSLNLPSSGTLDLRVTSLSTGQIYGAADLLVTPVSPGLFTVGATGTGQVAALNEDNTVNGPGNPIIRGHVIQLYATGQGQVTNTPADGTAAAASPLSLTTVTPQVVIGSITVDPANIQFSGLAPGLVGVWQINVKVPSTVTAGTNIPITVSLNSVTSNDPSNPATLRTTIALQ